MKKFKYKTLSIKKNKVEYSGIINNIPFIMKKIFDPYYPNSEVGFFITFTINDISFTHTFKVIRAYHDEIKEKKLIKQIAKYLFKRSMKNIKNNIMNQ